MYHIVSKPFLRKPMFSDTFINIGKHFYKAVLFILWALQVYDYLLYW